MRHAPLQIAYHHVEGSPELEALIEQKLDWLSQGHGRVLGCRVVIDGPARAADRGRLGVPYRLRLEVTVPGETLVVDRSLPRHREARDLGTLVREAFDVARRRLEDHAHKRDHRDGRAQGAVRASVSSLFAEQGYGFLRTPEGREIYFHRNVVGDGDFARLHVGAEVDFREAADGGEEGPRASSVRLLLGEEAVELDG
jgi:cold shock CspA family protein